MDVKRIKYNSELLKNKIRLQKELEMVNKEITKNQIQCKHINVCIGWCGPYLYRDTSINRCLLCGEDDPIEYEYNLEAQNYKKEKYSHGQLKEDRNKRFEELQNLVLEIMTNEPNIKEEELVKKLEFKIENNN